MPHWLFLPDDAMNDLEVLTALPPEKFQKLRKFLDSMRVSIAIQCLRFFRDHARKKWPLRGSE